MRISVLFIPWPSILRGLLFSCSVSLRRPRVLLRHDAHTVVIFVWRAGSPIFGREAYNRIGKAGSRRSTFTCGFFCSVSAHHVPRPDTAHCCADYANGCVRVAPCRVKNDKRTLYVGGLDDDVDLAVLRAAFIPFGEVSSYCPSPPSWLAETCVCAQVIEMSTFLGARREAHLAEATARQQGSIRDGSLSTGVLYGSFCRSTLSINPRRSTPLV